MEVTLPPELQQLVEERVASGQYSSPNEFIVQALWVMRDYEELARIRFEELKREIAIGLEAADRGEVLDGEQVMAELRQRYAQPLKRAG